jgi:uncharacterized protein
MDEAAQDVVAQLERPWRGLLLARLRAHLAAEPLPRDAAHDLSHTLRVAAWAARLAREEGADATVCVAAALLHDAVYLPKNHPESASTAARSAELARLWCAEVADLADRAGPVAEAIRTHSWSAGLEAGSLEARILQDADRLDALGAIGIARVFATGGSMGIRLWHPEDPWARDRPLDDKAHSLDHFAQKLLRLPERLHTATARREAQRRVNEMHHFLEALRQDLGGIEIRA